jgi:PAS domain S-box-containing protein
MLPFSDELIDLCDDLVFILDSEGNFVKVNKLGSMNLDYNSEEISGKHFFSILDESQYQTAAKSLSEILAGSDEVIFETVLKTRLGNRIDYKVKFLFLPEPSGIAVGGIAHSLAVKHRNEEKIKNLEARLIEASRLISIERARWKQDKSVLEELNKLKSEFISNISHELRTPLASIIGFSETILSDPGMSPGMREEFNGIILTEGKRLARLINEILEISRMESGKITLLKSDLDLTALLKESSENYIDLIRRKNLNFTFEYPQEDIFISGDREKLLNVFDGLLNNAVKFTPKDGRIKLILHKMNKEAEIILSDTGVGIPEKDLPQIFQKFYSINRADTDIPDSGMGLVFVKQIIDLHKGLILVHSEINKGTTFVIKLPYKNKSEGSP